MKPLHNFVVTMKFRTIIVQRHFAYFIVPICPNILKSSISQFLSGKESEILHSRILQTRILTLSARRRTLVLKTNFQLIMLVREFRSYY